MQHVVRIGLVREEMPELAIEPLVLVVADFDHAVFDTKGPDVVVAHRVFGNLRRPAVEILAVEEELPARVPQQRLVFMLRKKRGEPFEGRLYTGLVLGLSHADHTSNNWFSVASPD